MLRLATSLTRSPKVFTVFGKRVGAMQYPTIDAAINGAAIHQLSPRAIALKSSTGIAIKARPPKYPMSE